MALALGTTGCAQRQYLTSGLLAKAVKVDPRLQGIRVYPSAKFIAVYRRAVGSDTVVDTSAGGLNTTDVGVERLYPVGRKTPGAILSVDTEAGQPLLWITFSPRCTSKECAYGFVQGTDGLFRLTHVPELEGYSEATVYRKRVAKRKAMRTSTIYAKSQDVPIYVTTRGIFASIALEIPKQDKADTTVIVVPTEGVRPGMAPGLDSGSSEPGKGTPEPGAPDSGTPAPSPPPK